MRVVNVETPAQALHVRRRAFGKWIGANRIDSRPGSIFPIASRMMKVRRTRALAGIPDLLQHPEALPIEKEGLIICNSSWQGRNFADSTRSQLFAKMSTPTQAGSTGLAVKVATGTFWSAQSRIAVQALSLVSTAVVARKLGPNVYGLMNMAQIAIGLVSLFRDLGISSAVVQFRDMSQSVLSSLFWFNAGVGAIATIVCFAGAPLFAAFYAQPEVASLLKVLAISFVVTNLSAVHAGLLMRSMSFRLLAIVETGATLAGLILAIIFVYSGAGIWSLVAASITNSTVSTVGIVAFSHWRPSATLAWKDIRGVLRFGAGLSGFNILNYFGRNADNILIGKYLGPYPLGVYNIAYMVMLYPLQNVTALLGRVLFPALSEMQDDNPRFRKAYIRANCAIAFVAFPMLAGVAAVAEPFVTVWLGSKWLAAVPLLQLLAPVGIMQSVGATTGQVYTAKGRAGLMFKWALFAVPIMTLGFAIGLRWGVQGVVISYVVTNTLLTYPLFRLPFGLIDLPLWVFFKALLPYGLVTGAMYVVVVILKHWLMALGIQPLPVLLLTVGIGIVFYLGLGWLARLSAFNEIATALGLSFLHRRS